MRFCISNIAGELAVTYNQKVDLFNYNSGSIVVLFNYRPDLSDQKNREELSALAEQICEQVETLLETPITIGVSNPHEGAEGINLCFREAQSAVNYKLYVPTSKVIFISDMETKQAQGTFRYPTEAENELITVVKSGAQDYLPSTLDSYLGSLQESTSGPILFKNIIVEFLSRLSRMLYDSNCIPQEQLHFIRSAVEELELCRSLSEIRSWLMQILSGFTEEIGRNRKTDMTQEMERAKQYILEHYNEHIMLTDVAAIVHLSPTYFSSCFKEVVGETFMEYLTKTRIQKARELLSTGQYKVYEVASMVGYRDRRYFSEIFKKYTGKNPADYIT